MDPQSLVEDTEQTLFCPQTGQGGGGGVYNKNAKPINLLAPGRFEQNFR